MEQVPITHLYSPIMMSSRSDSVLHPSITTLVETDSAEASESPESVSLDLPQDSDGASPSEGLRLDHSLRMLDTLLEFYHHERKWIYEQRTSLQDNLDLDSGPELDEKNVPSSSKASSSGKRLKSDPPEISHPCITDCSQSRLSSSTLRLSQSPWRAELKPIIRPVQRGLGQPRLIVPPMGHRLQDSAENICSSPANVLDMFESMMQARLESCYRIDTIIRRARVTSTMTLYRTAKEWYVVRSLL